MWGRNLVGYELTIGVRHHLEKYQYIRMYTNIGGLLCQNLVALATLSNRRADMGRDWWLYTEQPFKMVSHVSGPRPQAMARGDCWVGRDQHCPPFPSVISPAG